MRDFTRHSVREVPTARRPLPVSGILVGLRGFTGEEDLLLAEGRPEDPALALNLVERLAWSRDRVDWAALCMLDIDSLIVRLRRAALGDRIIADVTCSNGECRCRVDLSFGLNAYLAHHQPKRPGYVEPLQGEPGWFVAGGKDGEKIDFRLPTIGEVVDLADEPDPVESLAALCLRPAAPPPRLRALAEKTMAALAPSLSGPIEGRCPQCGAAIAAHFDARTYCLRELCDRARFIYDDIDSLAERYHWSEQEILSLPNERRLIYAERARQARTL